LENKAGVNLLPDLSLQTIQSIKEKVRAVKREKDIVVASIHWGRNWGYEVSPGQVSFAHGLIEEAGVDLIHGHSSHHVKGIELYRGKLILYGCGDFLNDYEGIRGYEAYRDDLTLMYFARLDPATGRVAQLWMFPMQIKQFRLSRASATDARWLQEVLNREGEKFGTRVRLDEEGALRLPGGEKQAALPEEGRALRDLTTRCAEKEKGGRASP
jgi:poly-gamma-glutamate synthesis protein (capsule biosynthesis protein)